MALDSFNSHRRLLKSERSNLLGRQRNRERLRNFAKVLGGISITAALVFNSTSINAQSDETHKGFWLSFGAGGGWLQSERSATTYFRMGGTPNGRVLFGGQVIHWWQNEDIQHTNVSAILTLYPFYGRTNSGNQLREAFTRIGAGVATAHRFNRDDTGIGLNAGLGIDLRLNSNFFVTPNVDLLVDLFNDSTYTSVLVSVGFSWH